MADTLNRVADLLAKADNTDNEHERTAYMEKAMALASKASIDLAVARAHTRDKQRQEQVEKHQLLVNPIRRKYCRKAFMDLALAIANANDAICTISGSDMYLYATCFPSDFAVIEALFTTLQVQMTADADASLKRGDNKRRVREQKRRRVPATEEFKEDWKYESWENEQRYLNGEEPPSWMYEDVFDADGQPVMEDKLLTFMDGRTWRANFYQGFVEMTTGRLWAAKRKAQREAREAMGEQEEGGTVAIALRDKRADVRKKYDEEQEALNARGVKLGEYKGAEVSRTSWSAQERGQHAAKLARHGTEDGSTLGAARAKSLESA